MLKLKPSDFLKKVLNIRVALKKKGKQEILKIIFILIIVDN